MTRIPCTSPLVAALCGISLAAGGCDPTGLDPSGEVHGTALLTLVPPQPGSPPLVQSWEGRRIEAWFPSASGYETREGLVDSAGQFRISGVPAGPYWLVFPDDVTALLDKAKVFVWTEARELDLGYQTVLPESVPEALPLTSTFTGLSPVEVEDKLEIIPASRSWFVNWGPRPLGAEQATTPSPPARFYVRPGERISVEQWRTKQQGSLTASSIVKYGEGMVVTAGSSATLNVALTDPPARQLDLRVDHAEFVRQLGLNPPGGAPVRTTADFMLLTAPDLQGETLGRPEFALRLSGQFDQTQDPSMSGIRYSDPHRSDWTRIYELRYGASYPCTAQDTGRGCGGSIYARGPLSELATGTAQPRLSLPQGLAIDGRDAMTLEVESSQSPKVRWQAPVSGQVSAYLLSLIHLVPSGSPDEEDAALFITTKNELTLPPGVLQPGERYYFKLRALGGLDIDATAAPRRASLRKPAAESATRTKPFTVTATR